MNFLFLAGTCLFGLLRSDFADTKALDEFSVLHNVTVSQIRFESAALTNKFQQADSAVVILAVGLKVFRDLLNSLLHDRDLHFGRAGISVLVAVLLDDVRFDLLFEWHGFLGCSSVIRLTESPIRRYAR